ncbi:hypothetical protein AB0I16_35185 [Streptomyces sp. NPDC050703]|uniref:hypothetical protein n=1 Tax=Streptomyces sp. NPDC050703 TaxID=3157218 RepID=UPI00342101B7
MTATAPDGPRFRAEALAAYSGASARPAPESPPRVPRRPVVLLVVLAAVLAWVVSTPMVPRYVDGTVVAGKGATPYCLLPAGTPAGRLPGRRARIIDRHRTGETLPVAAAERVGTGRGLTARGLPADVPLPVVVVRLARAPGTATASAAGRAGPRRVAIEMSRRSLLDVLLMRGR